MEGYECIEKYDGVDFCRKIPYCGNGFKDYNESCDDFNQIDNDGCDNQC